MCVNTFFFMGVTHTNFLSIKCLHCLLLGISSFASTIITSLSEMGVEFEIRKFSNS